MIARWRRNAASALSHAAPLPLDAPDAFVEIYRRCESETMTSAERMLALWSSIDYLQRRGVDGDIVECGVWRGGSSMLAAMTLAALGDRSRTLYMYDTFEGMPPPG